MMKRISAQHMLDEDGNPAGGVTSGVGIRIDWQDGPLGRGAAKQEPTGASIEGIIEAAIDRLQFYQMANAGKFACRENAIALTHLETALLWLQKRTTDREDREVEGTNAP